jgi:hypothetical protein
MNDLAIAAGLSPLVLAVISEEYCLVTFGGLCSMQGIFDVTYRSFVPALSSVKLVLRQITWYSCMQYQRASLRSSIAQSSQKKNADLALSFSL